MAQPALGAGMRPVVPPPAADSAALPDGQPSETDVPMAEPLGEDDPGAPAAKRVRSEGAGGGAGVESPGATAGKWEFAGLGLSDTQLAALAHAHKHEELLGDPGVIGPAQLQQAIELADAKGMEHQATILRLHCTALSASVQGSAGASCPV